MEIDSPWAPLRRPLFLALFAAQLVLSATGVLTAGWLLAMVFLPGCTAAVAATVWQAIFPDSTRSPSPAY